MREYPKGSQWRQWDLHIHTPASFHWNGAKFKGNPTDPENYPLIDEMIAALNAAEPIAFALMDYWTFDGWFALQNRLNQPDSPLLNKVVFPGIELRLVAPMENRLNAHVLFSNDVADQVLNDFKAELKIGLINRSLSDYSLVQLARNVGADKLKAHNFDKDKVDEDERTALMAGSTIAEITCESYKKALKDVPENMALGFMPFDTNDGLSEVKWQEHYAYVLELFETSPIFETRKPDLCSAFNGVVTDGNKGWIENFQFALGNTPRLAVSGSDAHQFIGVAGDNNKRGYGNFPSGKVTWIKADPSFAGLQQAIKEPAKRSFIGSKPPKLSVYEASRSQFIDSIDIVRAPVAKDENGEWLGGTSIKLNMDLVAVIGNKGSGKSALADITALLGNSKQSRHFSFLKKDRFRGRNGEPAKYFDATLTWADEQASTLNLAENSASDSVELVKYIPQGHFEELCNSHVSGKSDAFEQELRSVIFSHADDGTRLGALNFDQLVEAQESTVREKLSHTRASLMKLNREISEKASQQEPEVKNTIFKKIKHKQHLLDELEKVKPTEVEKPTDEQSPDQKAVAEKLTQLTEEIITLTEKKLLNSESLTKVSLKLKATTNLKERIKLLKRDFDSFAESAEPDAQLLGIKLNDVAKLNISSENLDKIENELTQNLIDLQSANQATDDEVENLKKNKESLTNQLNAPLQKYQKYNEELSSWQSKVAEERGSKENPNSLEGLKARLEQLNNLPQQLKVLQDKQMGLCLEIFNTLDEQRQSREKLFSPVQELILNNELIREEYKLQFKSELTCTPDYFGSELFDLIKQNTGDLRGEEESFSYITGLMGTNDMNTEQGVKSFVSELSKKLQETSSSRASIKPLMRKNKEPAEVYDFIYGLEFLTPRYTLMFQGAHIEQLSPGQRGSLLLIFYLLVDKGSVPIILDQPEENLDNETIVSLLVPVLCKAKQHRQILMVTHNPNLAVVCDAEQIIHCDFDRKNNSKISYTTGAIESSIINQKVVNVLEGTMPAFNNRKEKYN